MANPQKENGFIPIANEIAEALGKIRIPGEAYQVLWAIWRKTYGFNKKDDWISLSQFAEFTGIKDRSHIIRNLKKLLKMNIIAKKGNGIAINGYKLDLTYSFNKDYESWKPLPKRAIIAKKGNQDSQIRQSALPLKAHTINNITKDNITKDNNIILMSVLINGYEYRLKKLRISISDYEEINKTHPGKDYANEAKKADLWLIDNPKKIRKNHVRYWNNWLENEPKYKERGNGSRSDNSGIKPAPGKYDHLS